MNWMVNKAIWVPTMECKLQNWERKGVVVEKDLIDSAAAAGCDAGAALGGRAGYGGSCDAGANGNGAVVTLCSGMGVSNVLETWSGSGSASDPSLCPAPPSLWCKTSLPEPQTNNIQKHRQPQTTDSRDAGQKLNLFFVKKNTFVQNIQLHLKWFRHRIFFFTSVCRTL